MSITLVKLTAEEDLLCNCLQTFVDDCRPNENRIARANYEAQKKKLAD